MFGAVELSLDDADQRLLREILSGAYRDLRFEVGDTDDRSYRRDLEEREARLAAILDLVGGPLPAET